MKMRACCVAGTLLLMLTACSSSPAPTGGEQQPESITQAELAAEAVPPLPEVLAEPVTGELLRVQFAAGDVIDQDAIYFLDTETGQGEGWVPAETSNISFFSAVVSDDNRFIIAACTSDDYACLLDRETGTTWRWGSPFRMYLAGKQGFLFGERVSEPKQDWRTLGRLIWAGPDMRPQYVFRLHEGEYALRGYFLSPDGEYLALLTDEGVLFRFALETGELRTLATFELGPGVVQTLDLVGDLIQVTTYTSEDDGLPPSRYERVTRYDWAGSVVADITPPGIYVTFSPDGRWITWEEWPLDWLAPVTVVADAQTLEPQFQALGATTCFAVLDSSGSRWLSDSSGLVVDSGDGYRLLTLDGQLHSLPAFEGLDWRFEPVPAPDNPDLFALGRVAVSDGAGSSQLGVTLEGFITPFGHDPWGQDSKEMRFHVPAKPGGGACVEGLPMAPAVRKSGDPLPQFPLVVDGVDGCLPLNPGEFGGETACLPNGTRLTALRPKPDHSARWWEDGVQYLWVKTEHGQTGEISLQGRPIRWAVE